MTLDNAMYILKHGTAEGEHKYFEAITVIEREMKKYMLLNMYIQTREEVEAEAIKKFGILLVNKMGLISQQHFNYGSVIECVNDLVKEMKGGAGLQTQGKVFYLCDRQACENCGCSDCQLTSNIEHARNFEKDENGNYIEGEFMRG